jgi:dTDP-4-dehydrorhamnose 3,5-epimerase
VKLQDRETMIFTETKLAGAYIVDLQKHHDNRGFFARAWCAHELRDHGIPMQVVQANLAHTVHKGTLRGLHYQIAPHAELKFFRCIRGVVYDVTLDLRPESPTFGQWQGIELSAENRRAIYIPAGFAHGYQTLTDDAEVFYMVSEAYAPGAESGIRWNDPAFEIDWPITANVILSDKDQNWPDYDLG